MIHDWKVREFEVWFIGIVFFVVWTSKWIAKKYMLNSHFWFSLVYWNIGIFTRLPISSKSVHDIQLLKTGKRRLEFSEISDSDRTLEAHLNRCKTQRLGQMFAQSLKVSQTGRRCCLNSCNSFYMQRIGRESLLSNRLMSRLEYWMFKIRSRDVRREPRVAVKKIF